MQSMQNKLASHGNPGRFQCLYSVLDSTWPVLKARNKRGHRSSVWQHELEELKLVHFLSEEKALSLKNIIVHLRSATVSWVALLLKGGCLYCFSAVPRQQLVVCSKS